MSKAPDDMSPEEMKVVAKRFNEQQRQSTTMRRKIDQLDRELQDHVLVLQQL